MADEFIQRNPIQALYHIDKDIKDDFSKACLKTTGKHRKESIILETLMKKYIERNK